MFQAASAAAVFFFLIPLAAAFRFLTVFAGAVARFPPFLAMANSSIECPSLSSAASHRGVAPLPAHVSPPGPRYFGGTDLPRIALTRPGRPAGRPRFDQACQNFLI